MRETSAPDGREAPKVGPDEEARRQGRELVREPPSMSKEDRAALEAFRKQVLAKGCTKGPLALSVRKFENSNGGQDVLLSYLPTDSVVVTNEGGAWGNNSTFFTPCPGLYFFAVDFVKDPTYHNGTTDDVYVFIAKNSKYVGYAWAGENDCLNSVKPQVDRGTGAYHVILRLVPGDYIQTYVGSDSGRPWHIYNCNFSGHRISD